MAFKPMDGSYAIIFSRGVYTHSDLFSWGDMVFAKSGRGYIRLKWDGSTSKDKTCFREIGCTKSLYKDKLGYLTISKYGSANSVIPKLGHNSEPLTIV